MRRERPRAGVHVRPLHRDHTHASGAGGGDAGRGVLHRGAVARVHTQPSRRGERQIGAGPAATHLVTGDGRGEELRAARPRSEASSRSRTLEDATAIEADGMIVLVPRVARHG